MAQRPLNFLVIMSDEHRRDAMGCMGHRHVKTPHLDALAQHGTVFERAYTASPMCVPTRAAVATGQPVHRTGHWDSASPYAGAPESWMHHLRAAGHEVVSIGKLHFRSAEDDNGFSQEILPMHVVGGVGWTVGLLRETLPDYSPSAAELAADVGVGSSSYTDYDLAITDAATEWLCAADRLNQPWAAFVSLVSPHYPLTCPEAFYNLYDPADMDLPVGAERPPTHSEVQNITGFFSYDQFFDEAKIREARCAYFGLTSFMDDCVGRVMDALKTSGQAENTVILYLSDHGDMLGDHGMWTKQVMYEASVGVPMIMAGPGLPVGRRVLTPASLLDIAPTAHQVMGVKTAKDQYFGTSLLNLAADRDQPRRTVFSEYHDGGSTTASFMVRWGNWKYIHYPGHAPQLFNLKHDEDEMCDLAPSAPDQPAAEAALAEGERRLRKICDPEAVNMAAFADQKRKIEALGGEEACLNAYIFNHTPAPKA